MISGAAEVLENAGLGGESDALLKAELTRSHYPYYFMLGPGRERQETRRARRGALEWAGKAYAAAEGDATRLQWGASYINAMVDLAPQDSARIENAR